MRTLPVRTAITCMQQTTFLCRLNVSKKSSQITDMPSVNENKPIKQTTVNYLCGYLCKLRL